MAGLPFEQRYFYLQTILILKDRCLTANRKACLPRSKIRIIPLCLRTPECFGTQVCEEFAHARFDVLKLVE
jgi:hypothetical protein